MPRPGRYVAALALAALCSCEGEGLKPHAPGGWTAQDGGVWPRPTSSDGVTLPSWVPADKEGPNIAVMAPSAGVTVIDALIRVEAAAVDKDGVDPGSVKVTLLGKEAGVVMTRKASPPDTYEAMLDVTSVSGPAALWVSATDLKGHTNSAVRLFQRDAGPTIEILAPVADGHFKGSVLVQARVTDAVGLQSFEIRVGKEVLKLAQTPLSSTSALFTATVEFASYSPPLTGTQTLTATAINKNSAKTVVQRNFTVDDEGPAIVIKTPKAGEIVGGTVHLQADVSDPAGVIPASVLCVIGSGASARTVQLVAGASPTLYEGVFDSRSFTTFDLWPVFSFRAADHLGNESHVDIQVGLDNVSPIAELDPQTQAFVGRFKEGLLECSHPFDAVGSDAANDLELAPQVVPIRARIEDRGNPVPSAKFVPVSLVDETSVWLYVLDATEKPLVVDSDGDGYCDALNPQVAPISGMAPKPDRAIAVNLAPIPVSGEANFTPWAIPGGGNTFPFAACVNGSEEKPPDPLCLVTTLTKTLFYTASATIPAIFTIPPAVTASKVQCMGLPFDFGANNIADGWACAAVVAADRLGNTGVSRPMRIWVDKTAGLSAKGSAPPGGAGSAPACTGTWNKTTNEVTAAPCTFRPSDDGSPQVYPPATLAVE